MSSGTVRVNLATLQQGLVPRLDRVRDEIQRVIEADFGLIAKVNSHLLRMQGKMLRPTLTLLSDEATGGPRERAVRLAAVVELIHLATLVHDDSVDHSVMRRGMPTVNAAFSHQISVIMGDYLYSRAVIELVDLDDLAPLKVLGRVTNEMTIGEMRQLLAHEPLGFTEADYDLLIHSKTASLLSGACEVGALEAPAAEREALRDFGAQLGMAFQIIDDLLDYTEEESVTGKPSGNDLREHKVTLPLIYALPRLNATERAQVDDLMNTAQPSDDQIAVVIAAVERTEGLSEARARAQRHCDSARALLGRLAPSAARDALESSLDYVMERRS